MVQPPADRQHVEPADPQPEVQILAEGPLGDEPDRRGAILTSRRDGKTVYYRADPIDLAAVLEELQGYLRNCCPRSRP